MEYLYETKNTCAKQIKVTLDKDVIVRVEFLGGGCPGNLQALPRLVEGMTVNEVDKRLEGIKCGIKNTSCADQLVQALKKALEEEKTKI